MLRAALLHLPRRQFDVGRRFAPLRVPQPPSVGFAHLLLDLSRAVGVCLAQRAPLALVVPVEILAPASRPGPHGPGPLRPAPATRARSDLVAALDMLASGRMTFPAHVTGLLWNRSRTERRRRDHMASLSERERETLFLTAAGYTAVEISRKIYLSPKTVANYRTSLKNKLGAKTRVDLMRIVVESGHIADMLRAAGVGQEDQ